MYVNTSLSTGETTQSYDWQELFGVDSTSNISPVIAVDNMPIQIRAYGLNENDLILVEMIHKGWYSPYCPFNGQSYLDKNKNILLIGLSGRYRFILTTKDGSKPSVGQVLVTHNNVEMSQQVFMAYMSCCGGENGN